MGGKPRAEKTFQHGISATEFARIALRAEARNYFRDMDTKDEDLAVKRLEIAAMRFAEAVAKDA